MRVHSTKMPSTVNRHRFSIPLDPGGDFVSLAELEASAWHASRMVICRRIDRDLRRHSPDRASLGDPVPLPDDEGDPWGDESEEVVDEAAADWWARNGDHVRDHHDQDAVMECGYCSEDDGTDHGFGDEPDGSPFRLGNEPAARIVADYLRPRATSMRIDAEDEARMWGWCR
jgi:hypothetical protein